MKKFEFKKAYEEVEIAGEIYKVSLKDEDRKKYQEQLAKFYNMVSKVEATDEDKIDFESVMKLEEEMKQETLKTLDVTIGEGSGEKLYEAADHQVEELFDIIWGIAEIINERREEKLNKYRKPKKKPVK